MNLLPTEKNLSQCFALLAVAEHVWENHNAIQWEETLVLDYCGGQKLVVIGKRSAKPIIAVAMHYSVKGSALPLVSAVIKQKPRSSSPHFWFKCSSAGII